MRKFLLAAALCALASLPAAAQVNSGSFTALPAQQTTYSAFFNGIVVAANPTDIITLQGSSTRVVRVLEVHCDATSTANGLTQIVALKRSTPDQAGTFTVPTAVAHDSNSPVLPAAIPAAYTVNATTVGTLVSNYRAFLMATVTSSSISLSPVGMNWNFADLVQGEAQLPTLRGANQLFALNGAATSFPAGSKLNCHMTWTENQS